MNDRINDEGNEIVEYTSATDSDGWTQVTRHVVGYVERGAPRSELLDFLIKYTKLSIIEQETKLEMLRSQLNAYEAIASEGK